MAEPLTQLGRFKVVAELGRGAMGVVYRAEDAMLNRTVAIKTILMSADAAERAEYEARFYQEAKAAGGLNHPNLITIYDIGREGDTAYMAMELLDGVDLRQKVREGQLSVANALDIAAQVADGLAFAHEHGVIHRDIKPANIMLVSEGRAKIMDFGIARVRMSDVKTQTGSVLGSPKYMSPEQVTGQRIDHRADIFALGVVMYEMITGRTPFGGADVTQLMHQIATLVPAPPSASNPSVPPMLDLTVARALEKTLERRYQSARELAADLRSCRAQLDETPAAAEAPYVKTVKVDIPHEDTVKAAPSAAADSGTHLPLSRRFDSTEGVRRLVKLATDGTAGGADALSATRPPAGGTMRRLWQDPGWLFVSVSVLLAAAAAIAIVVR